MAENLLYSVNAVIPIFILAILGALLRKLGKISDAFIDTADWIVFRLALPVMLFMEVASCSLSENLDLELILFLVISVTAGFLLVAVLSLIFIRDNTKHGAFIQGACRSNFAILGVPLAVNMFGDVGGQAIALSMPFVIIMFNTYSVVILSVFSNKSEHKLNKKSVMGILKNIATNPLIIAVVVGVLFILFDWQIPTAVDKTLSYVSNLTTPLALISLGAGFRAEGLHGRIVYAVVAAICKTVALPAVMLTIAGLIGLRGPSLGVILICFGAPSAVSSYIMSKKMNNDHELSLQILLLSTLMCAFTIFIGIFILKSLSLI